MTTSLPIPPFEMRELVGPTDPAIYDNASGDPIWTTVPAGAYDSVLDFGCGCGRIARQLRQQRTPPASYLGIDIHHGMIQWCQDNLAAPGFAFEHHDVYNRGLNPTGDHRVLPLPDGPFSLVNAWSVFTHLLEDQAVHYLHEAGRVLRPDGFLVSTWFIFDKSAFPMMQDFQNALYINPDDPTNAVIFDREWLERTAAEAGLVTTHIAPPAVHGFQWIVTMRPSAAGEPAVPFPEDTAEIGRIAPPLLPADAPSIGLRP
jgi:SAM-dependent methyltransferase